MSDDGVGGVGPTGAGLRGIAHRVEALEGRLSIHSPAGDGTRVEVVLPRVSGGSPRTSRCCVAVWC